MEPSSIILSKTHLSPVNYLKNIYTLEIDNKIVSVFFEFIESQQAKIYMQRVCYQASKMDLYPDHRIPKIAKKGFCFGFKATYGENATLIKKVEDAMTWASQAKYTVELIAVDSSMLESNPYVMEHKDYSDVFCCEIENQWTKR